MLQLTYQSFRLIGMVDFFFIDGQLLGGLRIWILASLSSFINHIGRGGGVTVVSSFFSLIGIFIFVLVLFTRVF